MQAKQIFAGAPSTPSTIEPFAMFRWPDFPTMLIVPRFTEQALVALPEADRQGRLASVGRRPGAYCAQGDGGVGAGQMAGVAVC